MKLTITDDKAKGFSFKDDSGVERNDQSVRAMGGTELMHNALMERLPEDLKSEFQIIPTRVRGLDENKKRILWVHDTYDDPEVKNYANPEFRKNFSKLVFVSHQQQQTFCAAHNIPFYETCVIKNAIVPIEEHTKSFDKIRLIYHTTPHRGLNILLSVFEPLVKKYGENLELDVYSSFKIYGWEQRDKEYEELFQICRDHEQINYHGTVSNDEIRKALTKSHIFAYPSIWPETSCIAAIEAMSARNLVVCPNLAALPETTANFAYMYNFDERIQEHANIFLSALDSAISNVATMDEQLKFQKAYFDAIYNWDNRIGEWETLLRGL